MSFLKKFLKLIPSSLVKNKDSNNWKLAKLYTSRLDEINETLDNIEFYRNVENAKGKLLDNLEGIDTVFDAGAGSGRFSILLAKHGCRVTHFDISQPMIDKAKELAEQGVKELILVAQETTIYGRDLYGEKSLHILLKELCKISGIRWIRLLYCYPEEMDDRLIQVIKEEKKICHYLDLPIQHSEDEILKRMGRRTTKEQLISLIRKLREEIPDIVLRTTLITGFPGETTEQHEKLLAFVDEMEFERLGVFAYSAEEDTPAAEFPDQIPDELKEKRRDEVMELQQEIAFKKSESMVGRVLDVMIEGKVADEPAYVARTYMDAPGVDGYLFVNSDELFMSGDFVRVQVIGAAEYDLIGDVFEERDGNGSGLEVRDESAQ